MLSFRFDEKDGGVAAADGASGFVAAARIGSVAGNEADESAAVSPEARLLGSILPIMQRADAL